MIKHKSGTVQLSYRNLAEAVFKQWQSDGQPEGFDTEMKELLSDIIRTDIESDREKIQSIKVIEEGGKSNVYECVRTNKH